MESKFIFIVIAALIIPWASSTSVGNQNEGTLAEVVEDTLQIITASINRTIEKVTPDIEQLLKALDYLKDDYFREAKKEILKKIENVNDTLSWQIISAFDTSTEVKCLEDIRQQLSVIQSKAINSSMNCIQMVTQPVADDTLAVLFTLTHLKDDITKEKTNLDECQMADDVLECTKVVISNLVKFALSAPAQVQLDNDMTQNNYEQILYTFQSCLQDASVAVEEEIVGINQQIVQCGNSFSSNDDDDDDYFDLFNNDNDDDYDDTDE